MTEKLNITLPCFWSYYDFDWSNIAEFKVEDIENLEYYKSRKYSLSPGDWGFPKYSLSPWDLGFDGFSGPNDFSEINDINSYQPSEVLYFNWDDEDSQYQFADKSYFTLISIKKVPKNKSYYQSYDNLPRWFDNHLIEIEVNPNTQKGSEFIETFGSHRQPMCYSEHGEDGGQGSSFNATVAIKFDSKKNNKSIIHTFLFCPYSLSNIIRSYIPLWSFEAVAMMFTDLHTGEKITIDVPPPHVKYNFRRGNMPYKNISGRDFSEYGGNTTESHEAYRESFDDEDKYIHVEV